METIRLTAPTTAQAWIDIDPATKVETLDQSFRRNRKRLGTTLTAETYHTNLWSFRQATASGRVNPSESLNLGEIFAAWVSASLDALEEEYSAELTRLLDAYRYDDPANSTLTHAEFCEQLRHLDISIGTRRAAVCKRAYGITYKEFVA